MRLEKRALARNNEQLFVEFALAMPQGINRDVIASRAELWSKYGRGSS